VRIAAAVQVGHARAGSIAPDLIALVEIEDGVEDGVALSISTMGRPGSSLLMLRWK
jgi:hypothetical protein